MLIVNFEEIVYNSWTSVGILVYYSFHELVQRIIYGDTTHTPDKQLTIFHILIAFIRYQIQKLWSFFASPCTHNDGHRFTLILNAIKRWLNSGCGNKKVKRLVVTAGIWWIVQCHQDLGKFCRLYRHWWWYVASMTMDNCYVVKCI